MNELNSRIVTLEEGARPICTLALGSFCETHGPTIVFSTQAFASSSLCSVSSEISTPTTTSPPSQSPTTTPQQLRTTTTPTTTQNQDSISSSLVLLPRRAQQQPQTTTTTTPKTPTTSLSTTNLIATSAPSWRIQSPSTVLNDYSITTSPPNISCPLCSSLPETIGFVTHDLKTFSVLVSKRTLAESYTIIKQACIRTLSCEWSPKDPNLTFIPIFHGSASVGYTLSFLFRLEDSTARGEGRWYTIVSTWQDPTYLIAVSCSGILADSIKPLIADLQNRASKLRLQEWSPAIRGNKSKPVLPRSLADVVGVNSKQLFRNFHIAFSKALIACDRKLFTIGNNFAPQFISSYNLIHQQQNQPQQQQQQQQHRNNLRLTWILNSLGTKGSRILLYNCAVGNQIIIRAPSDMLGPAVRAISRFLPEALRGTIIESSLTYKQPWEAHILGIPFLSNIENDDYFKEEGESNDGNDSEKAILVISEDGKHVNAKGPFEQTTIVEEIRIALETPSNAASPPAILQALRLQLVHEKWINLAKIVCALRVKGIFNTEQGINVALNALHVDIKDLNVIKFWSACVRKRVFSSSQI